MGQPVPQSDLPIVGNVVPPEDLPQGYTNPIKPLQQGIYGGVADILGAPVDLASILTGEQDPAGGSRSIRRGMAGITLPSGAPLTYRSIEEVPQEFRPIARAGEAIGGSVPITGVPFAVTRPLSRVPQTVRPIVEAARTKPGQFIAAEAAATFGAAQGAAAAEMLAPDSPTARFTGEVGGAIVNPIGLALRGVTRGISEAKTAIQGMTAAGRRSKAAELIQEAIQKAGEDPVQLARLLRQQELAGVRLTSGQKVGSPTLLAFEAKLASRSPEFDAQAKARAQESFSGLRRLIDQMGTSGDPELLRTAARIRQSYFNDLISVRMSQTQREVEKTLKAFSGNKQEASVRATSQIEEALTDARKLESELWEKIPRGEAAKPENLLQAHQRIRSGMLPEEPLPPQFIEAFVGRVSKQGSVTSGELVRFRSQMLSKAREARAQGKFGEARQYSQMAEGALADMETIPGGAAEEARGFSRAFHDAFTKTFAGETMAVRETGAQRIAPEVMLEKAFGAGGTTADVRFRELQGAAQFPGTRPGILNEQEEFLRTAARATTDPQTGRVNPQALEGFARTNEPLLSRFPMLRQELSGAVSAERAFREVAATAKQATSALGNTAFARVLGVESPSEAIRAVVGSKSPTQDYLQLVKLARRGPVGAVDGLKSSTLEYAARQATDATGGFSFEKYREILNRPLSGRGPSLTQIMDTQGVMTRGEAARLNEILKRAHSIDQALKSRAKMDELVDAPDALFDLVVRITGANIGGAAAVGQISGAPIVAAGAGSRFARLLFEKVPRTRIMNVLEEAAKDPKLMAALLEKPRTPARTRQLYNQINAALIQAGLTADEPSGRVQEIPNP